MGRRAPCGNASFARYRRKRKVARDFCQLCLPPLMAEMETSEP